MQFSTAFLTLALTFTTGISAIALPGPQPAGITFSGTAVNKRAAEAAAAPIPPSNTPTIAPGPYSEGDGDDEDLIGLVPEDDDILPADEADEAHLNALRQLPADDDDDDDDLDNALTTTIFRRDLEKRGVLDILKKKISKTALGRKVWNRLPASVRKQIQQRFKGKPRAKVTSGDKSWIKKLVKTVTKSVLKGIIGNWAANIVLNTVLPWVVDVILSIIY